jgi:predicted kinase
MATGNAACVVKGIAMPELIVMVGPSGSGKSTWVKRKVEESGGKMVRLNRDDMRLMVHDGKCKARNMETYISAMQHQMAERALNGGFNVIVDDTNLNEGTRRRWKDLATRIKVEHREYWMDTSLGDCLMNDTGRSGPSRVGAAVIMRQFLESGRLPISGRPIVIVDVDGTLADHEGIRSPYDESKVHLDNPYPVIVEWVRELSKDHDIYIVSGRHSTCGEATIDWMNDVDVPFDYIFMRHAWDNRADTVVKKEILDALLKLVPRERIAFVIDDRPKVIRMWKENGLRVFPARGAVEEF